MNVFDIIEYAKKSKVFLIGYSYQHERKKDNLISFLPHVSILDYDIKTFSRDEKISNIIDDSPISQYILIDTISLRLGFKDNQPAGMNVVRHIRSLVNHFSNTNYKLIITAPLRADLKGYDSSSSPYVGNRDLMFFCDFAISISDKVEVIKNRWGSFK